MKSLVVKRIDYRAQAVGGKFQSQQYKAKGRPPDGELNGSILRRMRIDYRAQADFGKFQTRQYKAKGRPPYGELNGTISQGKHIDY